MLETNDEHKDADEEDLSELENKEKKNHTCRETMCWYGRKCTRADCWFKHPGQKTNSSKQTPRKNKNCTCKSSECECNVDGLQRQQNLPCNLEQQMKEDQESGKGWNGFENSENAIDQEEEETMTKLKKPEDENSKKGMAGRRKKIRLFE